MRSIELLSPARNLECGRQAILCGADAVYIGARAFGARAMAGNSTEDIHKLCQMAHPYGAKVYTTINTIVYDKEIPEVEQLTRELYDAGVDALITQDLALLQINSRIPLHSSTQMDNRTPEQVEWLSKLGFERAVLARELSLAEIKEIHEHCPQMELEAFVHGALCVSYSGKCYASQYCFGRSANRGECAQFCRMAFNLEDSQGHTLLEEKHLLSLRDMNRSQFLGEMIDAGVMSFKIEGRLKDVDYVKNITAFYHSQLNAALKERPNIQRASFGESRPGFTPDPIKSFNRGFTTYFLQGNRRSSISSIHTPKALGEPVGKVKDIMPDNAIRVTSTSSFHNGDGICFIDKNEKLQGFRINRANGNLLYPAFIDSRTNYPAPRTPIFRNHDEAFVKSVKQDNAVRTIDVDILLTQSTSGFQLSFTSYHGISHTIDFEAEHILARSSQTDRQIAELSKLGGSILHARRVDIKVSGDFFIPASLLGQWRKQMISEFQLLLANQLPARKLSTSRKSITFLLPYSYGSALDFTANVANQFARQAYLQAGATSVSPAFELQEEFQSNPQLMVCRHCIRFELGLCPRHPNIEAKHTLKLQYPLYLSLPHLNKRFQLVFNCLKCQMEIYPAHEDK